ncbi:MAG: tetratricopeptide repeat protein [Bdellovibrionales bacterium]|nr:tetratricopeptide repeat protein [Bdellovibrionales bacterium]
MFKKAAGREPSHIQSRLSLGVCFLRLRRPERAKEQFEAALALDRQYAPSYYSLASYYAAVGDADSAVKQLQKAISLYPKIKEWVKEDPDFEPIRGNPNLQKLAGF